ncbi:hypothetical protein [Lentilactobacillus diolivorans]|uniref:Uncharacterized protein n=2 Tax=Lentilactobacillus diolivorans TaxID=179838 RepID=A0A0R1SG07_9LACO|nr:hypothetical protein [Lentilactobacillus diolivorans]KRL65013.1 hypothetical protein FC85_GL000810 [Lentilactobacillus diolivorans DSM 14421]GEP24274.1 hypothetical protein LDI01_18670 [Lentilactobacillus diolivorans]
MKKISLAFLKGLLIIIGLCLLQSGSPVHAKAVLPSKLNKANLVTYYTYFRANKNVTLKTAYTPSYKIGKSIIRNMTIKKGTIVEGQHNGGSKSRELLIDERQLSYHTKRTGILPGYTLDPYPDSKYSNPLSANVESFTRVKRPTYMPAYSDGNLYQGDAAFLESKKRPNINLRITPDGYLEYYKRNSKVEFSLQFLQKPNGDAKINKTLMKGNTRYFYTSKKVNGLKATKVNSKGSYQYRYQLTNLHQPQFTPGDPDNDIPGSYDSLYRLSGKTYYTQIGTDD